MANLKLQAITKRFGATQALKGIELDIRDGEFLTLVGPSGCGKSTLLRIIAGLEEQSGGDVLIADKRVSKVRPSERDLAMVFQSYALYPHLSVFDNIAVPLRMRWLSTWQRLPLAHWLVPGTRAQERNITGRVAEASEILGLQELLNRKPAQLSGGQRQRVAVGRAIVRHPKVFLFDEPLSNLDAKLRVHMRTEITQLHRRLRSTFIYVTHDQTEAMTMSDRIAVMMEGELVQVGTPSEVYQNPRDVRVAEFIGSPKINLFPGSVTSNGNVYLLGKETALCLEAPLAGETIQIGIRPEHLCLADPERAIFSGVVQLIENLGAEVFLHLHLDGGDQSVIVRLPHDLAAGIAVKHRVHLDFPRERALVFDLQGRRVDTEVAEVGPVREAAPCG